MATLVCLARSPSAPRVDFWWTAELQPSQACRWGAMNYEIPLVLPSFLPSFLPVFRASPSFPFRIFLPLLVTLIRSLCLFVPLCLSMSLSVRPVTLRVFPRFSMSLYDPIRSSLPPSPFLRRSLPLPLSFPVALSVFFFLRLLLCDFPSPPISLPPFLSPSLPVSLSLPPPLFLPLLLPLSLSLSLYRSACLNFWFSLSLFVSVSVASSVFPPLPLCLSLPVPMSLPLSFLVSSCVPPCFFFCSSPCLPVPLSVSLPMPLFPSPSVSLCVSLRFSPCVSRRLPLSLPPFVSFSPSFCLSFSLSVPLPPPLGRDGIEIISSAAYVRLQSGLIHVKTDSKVGRTH